MTTDSSQLLVVDDSKDNRDLLSWFGIARVLISADRERSAPLGEAISGLRGEVERWCRTAGVRDDVSVLAVEFTMDAQAQHGI